MWFRGWTRSATSPSASSTPWEGRPVFFTKTIRPSCLRTTPHGCHPKLVLGCSGARVESDWVALHGCHPKLVLGCSGAGVENDWLALDGWHTKLVLGVLRGWVESDWVALHGCHPKLVLGCSGAGVESVWVALHGCHTKLVLGCSGAGGCKARSRLRALNSGMQRERFCVFEAGERIGGLSRRRLSCGSDDGNRSLGPTGLGNLTGRPGYQAFGLRSRLAAFQA